MAGQKHISDSDTELLIAYYKAYDNKFLGILLERYTMLLFGICMKYLKDEERARDAVQQIYEKTITELRRHKVEFFKSWLYMVAKNHCLMQLRSKPGQIVELQDRGMHLQATETDFEKLNQKEISLQKLEKALPMLNEEQAACIRLFYLQNFSYQEISNQTNFTVPQVKSHIQNGKRNLKILIERMT